MRSTRRSGTIGGQFAPRLIELLEAPAWRVASLSARRVIERIEIELGHHGGNDNGRLIVTYDDFERYGIDRHAIAPAIREAEALGFIEITQRGRAGNAKWRAPNTFRLTFCPSKRGGSDSTHEWRRIKTIEAAKAIAKTARTKNISQWGKTPSTSGGNPHWRRKSPVGETPTTSIVGKPPLLSISGVGVPQRSNGAHLPRRRGQSGDGGGASA